MDKPATFDRPASEHALNHVFAKKSRNGVSINLDFELDDGRAIRVKKVNEREGMFFATQMRTKGSAPGSLFEVGDIIYTKKTEHGRQMCLRIIKRQGKKWLMKILS